MLIVLLKTILLLVIVAAAFFMGMMAWHIAIFSYGWKSPLVVKRMRELLEEAEKHGQEEDR